MNDAHPAPRPPPCPQSRHQADEHALRADPTGPDSAAEPLPPLPASGVRCPLQPERFPTISHMPGLWRVSGPVQVPKRQRDKTQSGVFQPAPRPTRLIRFSTGPGEAAHAKTWRPARVSLEYLHVRGQPVHRPGNKHPGLLSLRDAMKSTLHSRSQSCARYRHSRQDIHGTSGPCHRRRRISAWLMGGHRGSRRNGRLHERLRPTT